MELVKELSDAAGLVVYTVGTADLPALPAEHSYSTERASASSRRAIISTSSHICLSLLRSLHLVTTPVHRALPTGKIV